MLRGYGHSLSNVDAAVFTFSPAFWIACLVTPGVVTVVTRLLSASDSALSDCPAFPDAALAWLDTVLTRFVAADTTSLRVALPACQAWTFVESWSAAVVTAPQDTPAEGDAADEACPVGLGLAELVLFDDEQPAAANASTAASSAATSFDSIELGGPPPKIPASCLQDAPAGRARDHPGGMTSSAG